MLEIRAESNGGPSYREERVYARKVADPDGHPVAREHFAFVKGARVLSDTRLAADETRTEKFVFPAPKGQRFQVKANFWYVYSPVARKEAEQRILFLTLTQFVY